MKKWMLLTISILMALSVVVAACGPAAPAGPTPPAEECALRVGMVSDIGGIDDASFNENTWLGVEMAQEQLGICGQFIESQAQADYEKNITEFAEQDYDMIITVGFLLGDATAKMAAQYPDVNFAIVDFAYSPGIPNVQGIVFATDQAAFLSGYLGAYWADTQDPEDPQCGYVAGMQIPTVEIFVAGHDAGIKYYNEQHDANVQWKGVYVGDFEAPDEGKIQGESLLDEGVDVIFGIGGKTGNGGITAAKERGKWGVGVDVDQYFTLPNEKDVLLTSTMKRLDNAVFGTIEGLLEGEFSGGAVYVGTLSNTGVGLAPFHDFEDQIPEEIAQELNKIALGIIDGSIDTGWEG
ncbi:MAG: BMP family ABC transporter substrate-binding protein [Anaerolineae bacterium]|nr:BMP family ABC transporter substrate-binding protein [Anaerolineae bacterium]